MERHKEKDKGGQQFSTVRAGAGRQMKRHTKIVEPKPNSSGSSGSGSTSKIPTAMAPSSKYTRTEKDARFLHKEVNSQAKSTQALSSSRNKIRMKPECEREPTKLSKCQHSNSKDDHLNKKPQDTHPHDRPDGREKNKPYDPVQVKIFIKKQRELRKLKETQEIEQKQNREDKINMHLTELDVKRKKLLHNSRLGCRAQQRSRSCSQSKEWSFGSGFQKIAEKPYDSQVQAQGSRTPIRCMDLSTYIPPSIRAEVVTSRPASVPTKILSKLQSYNESYPTLDFMSSRKSDLQVPCVRRSLSEESVFSKIKLELNERKSVEHKPISRSNLFHIPGPSISEVLMEKLKMQKLAHCPPVIDNVPSRNYEYESDFESFDQSSMKTLISDRFSQDKSDYDDYSNSVPLRRQSGLGLHIPSVEESTSESTTTVDTDADFTASKSQNMKSSSSKNQQVTTTSTDVFKNIALEKAMLQYNAEGERLRVLQTALEAIAKNQSKSKKVPKKHKAETVVEKDDHSSSAKMSKKTHQQSLNTQLAIAKCHADAAKATAEVAKWMVDLNKRQDNRTNLQPVQIATIAVAALEEVERLREQKRTLEKAERETLKERTPPTKRLFYKDEQVQFPSISASSVSSRRSQSNHSHGHGPVSSRSLDSLNITRGSKEEYDEEWEEDTSLTKQTKNGEIVQLITDSREPLDEDVKDTLDQDTSRTPIDTIADTATAEAAKWLVDLNQRQENRTNLQPVQIAAIAVAAVEEVERLREQKRTLEKAERESLESISPAKRLLHKDEQIQFPSISASSVSSRRSQSNHSHSANSSRSLDSLDVTHGSKEDYEEEWEEDASSTKETKNDEIVQPSITDSRKQLEEDFKEISNQDTSPISLDIIAETGKIEDKTGEKIEELVSVSESENIIMPMDDDSSEEITFEKLNNWKDEKDYDVPSIEVEDNLELEDTNANVVDKIDNIIMPVEDDSSEGTTFEKLNNCKDEKDENVIGVEVEHNLELKDMNVVDDDELSKKLEMYIVEEPEDAPKDVSNEDEEIDAIERLEDGKSITFDEVEEEWFEDDVLFSISEKRKPDEALKLEAETIVKKRQVIEDEIRAIQGLPPRFSVGNIPDRPPPPYSPPSSDSLSISSKSQKVTFTSAKVKETVSLMVDSVWDNWQAARSGPVWRREIVPYNELQREVEEETTITEDDGTKTDSCLEEAKSAFDELLNRIIQQCINEILCINDTRSLCETVRRGLLTIQANEGRAPKRKSDLVELVYVQVLDKIPSSTVTDCDEPVRFNRRPKKWSAHHRVRDNVDDALSEEMILEDRDWTEVWPEQVVIRERIMNNVLRRSLKSVMYCHDTTNYLFNGTPKKIQE